MADEALIEVLTGIREELANLNKNLAAVAGSGLSREIRTSFSDKVVVQTPKGTRDCLITVGLGKQVPASMDRKEVMVEYNALKGACEKLVENWGNETVARLAKKEGE